MVYFKSAGVPTYEEKYDKYIYIVELNKWLTKKTSISALMILNFTSSSTICLKNVYIYIWRTLNEV